MSAKLVTPAGSKHEDWYLYSDKTRGLGGFAIKRWVQWPNGERHYERLPPGQFRHLLDDEKELRRFVVRLNGRDPDEDRVKARFEYRSAFLSPELLRGYLENHLSTQIPNQKDARSMYGYLERYGLQFFVNKLGLANPLDWHREQERWAKSLLNKPGDILQHRIFDEGEIMSAKVLRQVVNEMNRLLKYLHRKRPSEVPPLKLDPFSRAALKDHDARRKLICEVKETKYIRPQHRELIFEEMKRRNLPWRFAPILAYAYGLRRTESLGQRLHDVRRQHLEVEAQLDCFEVAEGVVHVHHKPVKDKEMRKVPHWVLKPSEAYYLIEQVQAFPIHPDTLTKHFLKLTEELFGGDGRYTYHDLRRTWITDMLKDHASKDVRLAAGHAQLSTTYKHYVKDTRELDGDVFVQPVRPVANF